MPVTDGSVAVPRDHTLAKALDGVGREIRVLPSRKGLAHSARVRSSPQVVALSAFDGRLAQHRRLQGNGGLAHEDAKGGSLLLILGSLLLDLGALGDGLLCICSRHGWARLETACASKKKGAENSNGHRYENASLMPR